MNDLLQNQWEGRAFRNYGRRTRLILSSTAMYITMRGLVLCTRTYALKKRHCYKGSLNGTIHVVAGGGGVSLSPFTALQTKWGLFKDHDYGFVKLTAFNHSNLLFEYKKSRDGKVYESFRTSRDYRDILACTRDNCPSTTLGS